MVRNAMARLFGPLSKRITCRGLHEFETEEETKEVVAWLELSLYNFFKFVNYRRNFSSLVECNTP